MLHHVALVRTDDLVERITSIITVTRSSEPETTLAVSINQSTLQWNTRATPCNILEDGMFHSHYRENLKFYIWKIVLFTVPRVRTQNPTRPQIDWYNAASCFRDF
jgi:hypothetical protein